MRDLFAHPAPSSTWRFFWPVLLLALIARFALAQTAVEYIHPDQAFQYLEPGFRLVRGYGLVSWEWIFGMRSWLVPFGVAGLIWTSDAVGLPFEPVVELAFCLISLAIPVGIYRFAQHILPEPQAVAAFLIGCFWSYFIHHGGTPMPSMLASAPMIWAAVLMLRIPTRQSMLVIGALFALTLAIRYQLVPAVGMLALFALWKLRSQFLWVAVGGLVVIAIVGLIDLFTWGGFLWSFFENFRMNFSEGVSERFGVDPVWYYFAVGFVDTGGVLYAMAIGVLLLWRRAWPIWAAVAIGFAFFHIPAHKELRFIVWVMPFGAVGLAHLGFRLLNLFPAWSALGRTSAIVFAGWVALASALYIPFQFRIFDEWHRGIDATQVMRFLGQQEDLTAAASLTDAFEWFRTGGYYTLGKPVPVYFRYHRSEVDFDNLSAHNVSHVVVEQRERPAPEGFEKIYTAGHLEVWRAPGPQTFRPGSKYNFSPDSGMVETVSRAPQAQPFLPIPTRFPAE